MSTDELRHLMDYQDDHLRVPDAWAIALVAQRQKHHRRVTAAVASSSLIAAAVAAVLALGGWNGGGNGASTTPADGRGKSSQRMPDLSGVSNVREVTSWDGETVTFAGVTVPVPVGWTVREYTGAADEMACADSPPQTVWLVEITDNGGAIDCAGSNLNGSTVIVGHNHFHEGGSTDGANPIALDPTGQPVYQPSLQQPSISFPWLSVSVTAQDLPGNEALPLLRAVVAEAAQSQPGLHIPDRIQFLEYQRFGGSSREDPAPNGRADAAAVREILDTATPADSLRCLPKVGAVLSMQGFDAQSGPPPYVTSVVLDTSGECTQVFDSVGGVATLDKLGLQRLSELVRAAPSHTTD
jgi:hypothetical protein